MYAPGWTITEPQFDPTKAHHQETVFTLGNGYLGTRGTFEEGYPGAKAATFINGVYDDIAIAYTELANCPDWLSMVIAIAGEYFSLARGQILSYQRQLDLRRGILSRDIRWRSPGGHTVDLHFERFTSMADLRVVGIRCQVTPIDFGGEIEIQAGINGYPDNQGVKHWEWINQGIGNSPSPNSHSIWLHLRTHHSDLELAMAARLDISDHQTNSAVPVKAFVIPGYPILTASFSAHPGQTVTAEKVVSIFTTRETQAPAIAAVEKLISLPDYQTLRESHCAAWAKLWKECDVLIEGDTQAQLAVRYNLFQLLQAAPQQDSQVSIPAKTLSGFAYRGHVFWDTEIFIVPFLTFTQPAIARNLLSYRYHTLPGARRKAAASGYKGAMFAWESATSGDEVTPRWVPDAEGTDLVRIWCGDIEQHITADVAYAVWQYWQATGDDDWMHRYGAEILLETATFWSSRVEWNGDRHRYEIRDVIGPDEYHDHVNNNAFTNQMARWNLETALLVWQWLQEQHPDTADRLKQQLGLNSERLEKWAEIADRLWIPVDPQTGLIEQAEGFFSLEDINLTEWEPRQRSMQAILGIEGANKRQVLKQADVLMLLYLLRDRYDRQTLQVNWDYYNPRTDHTYGSSLGPAIHASLACALGNPAAAYEHFMRAALVDLEDVRGNAGEGIHAASTGGVWQSIAFGFGGVRFTEQGPVATPHLPPGWTRLKFKLCWRDRWYEFDLRPENLAETPAIQAVIFDLDGVLTDTAEYHYLGWKRLADEEGIPFDRQANEAMRGLARRDSLLQLLGDRKATEAQFQEMMERKNRYYVELIEGITAEDLLPGVSEFLAELRAAGIKIGIGSASKNARSVVQRLGIGQSVDAIADGYSVVRSKPAPDLFLHAAEQLGVAPEACIVLEDADSGVQAALAAGMWAVGLGPQERFQKPHLVLPSLEGVRWEELLATLATVGRSSVIVSDRSATTPSTLAIGAILRS